MTGCLEHAAKAHDPMRWAADRGRRVSHRVPERSLGHTRLFGTALMSCAVLAALASARRAFRWMRHMSGSARLSR